ncbi:hypothetical protein BD414DRAFT_565032 [Trametes punicea]|nr:hypothetical protein BD414DRAFT_565032 [Trametes punicea]
MNTRNGRGWGKNNCAMMEGTTTSIALHSLEWKVTVPALHILPAFHEGIMQGRANDPHFIISITRLPFISSLALCIVWVRSSSAATRTSSMWLFPSHFSLIVLFVTSVRRTKLVTSIPPP